MDIKRNSYVQVHLAIFLLSMTGLFGKFMKLSPFIIVLGRVVVASIFVLIWLILSKEPLKLNNKSDFKKLVAMGCLLAIHWTAFFAAIQLTNVATGILTFSTFPVFVSLFRPVIDQAKLSIRDLVFAFITIIGILFILPLDDLFTSTMAGSLIGVISGATYAVFTIYNEKLVKTYSGKKVAFYEQASAAFFLLPSLFIIRPVFETKDIVLILLLGSLFTGVAQTMFISGLKNVSAYMASIITMLEPLYSIVLAYFILGEELNLTILIGGIIILSTVIFVSFDNLKVKKMVNNDE